MVRTIVALQWTMDLSIGVADIAYRMKHTWGQVTGKGLFESRPSMVCVDVSIVAAFPKPPSSGENYFNQVHDRRAPDIPSTCHQAHSQANRTRGADNSHPVSGEQNFGWILISPYSLLRMALERSQSQDTPGSSSGNLDLQAQLRMMSPALQEYVRKLQIKAQMRKDTSQLEDEDVLGRDEVVWGLCDKITLPHFHTLPDFASKNECGIKCISILQ